ncbi:hypothetical protein CR513_23868, partial [Mucuna pruriens]
MAGARKKRGEENRTGEQDAISCNLGFKTCCSSCDGWVQYDEGCKSGRGLHCSPMVVPLLIWLPRSGSVLKQRPFEGEFSPFLSMNHSIKLDLFFLDYKRKAYMEADLQCSNAIQSMEKRLRAACNASNAKIDNVSKDSR